METGWNENRAVLRGVVAAPPVPSHENHGVRYDLFPLTVRRLSGVEDRLNIIAAAPLLQCVPLQPGDQVEVEGEVRSFNNRSGQGSRLVITLYARHLRPVPDEPHCNDLTLAGSLCKPPVYRRTPMGREICDLLLAVNRRYGRADYLPCIAWGVLARQCASLHVGDGIRLAGRLQSRAYTKVDQNGSQRRTAYEISIMSLSPAGPDAAIPEQRFLQI